MLHVLVAHRLLQLTSLVQRRGEQIVISEGFRAVIDQVRPKKSSARNPVIPKLG